MAVVHCFLSKHKLQSDNMILFEWIWGRRQRWWWWWWQWWWSRLTFECNSIIESVRIVAFWLQVSNVYMCRFACLADRTMQTISEAIDCRKMIFISNRIVWVQYRSHWIGLCESVVCVLMLSMFHYHLYCTYAHCAHHWMCNQNFECIFKWCWTTEMAEVESDFCLAENAFRLDQIKSNFRGILDFCRSKYKLYTCRMPIMVHDV